MKYFQDLLSLWFIITTVSSMTISPHGGYLSIDEGTDFYIECIGNDAKWIIAKRLISDNARLSTQLIEHDRKSILTIHGMDVSLAGPYLCQTNQSVSTIILQLIKRNRDMTKQIRFMGTSTNQSVVHGSDVRLNCYAQYYSEKAMDSPYLPKILWFFERRQLYTDDKHILGIDSLVLRNFTYYDQGVYYCRAFITLKNNFLTKLYPIFVHLQDFSSHVNDTVISVIENRHCDGFNDVLGRNNTMSYCNTDGFISNLTCPVNQSWNEVYSQCLSPSNQNQLIQIIPNLSHLNVELGRIYTFVCRTTDHRLELEWTYSNGTIIGPNTSPDQQITTYTLNETHALYLRLAPVTIGTYICRSRPVVVPLDNSNDKQEVTMTTTSITLTAQIIAETNGISFQSSTLAEYHVRANVTLFVACRPEYFDFELKINSTYLPIANLIRINDNSTFQLSELNDGLLIDHISKNASGMYLCMGKIPLPERLITSIYPIMVFVSDSL